MAGRLLAGLAWLLASLTAQAAIPQAEVSVFAAASLTQALRDIAGAYEASHPDITVKPSFAASSTLARQIAAGAPAEVFVSADQPWMDYLAERQRIEPASRRDLLGNTLVLIAPTATPRSVALARSKPPAFTGPFCLAEPNSVPAGRYGKQALQALDWWTALASRLVATEDVRGALAFVARGECALGIVYETDARVSDKVMIAARFPATLHEPVIYPMALMPSPSPAARDFFQYLQGRDALAIFRRHGFRAPVP